MTHRVRPTRVGLILFVLLLLPSIARAIGPLPTDLAGDGLVVHFTKNDATPAGTLTLAGNTYAFGAARQGDQLVGNFLASGQSFPFTLTQTPAGFSLSTGGSTYALTASAGPESPGVPQPLPPGVNGRGAGDSPVFDLVSLKDPKTQLDFATARVPVGWTAAPNIVWRPKQAVFVADASAIFDRTTGWGLRFFIPDQFNVLPAVYQNFMQRGLPPFGSNGMELCDRVFTPADYVTQIVLPRYRRIEGLQVSGAKELPDLCKQVEMEEQRMFNGLRQTGNDYRINAIKLTITYPGPGGSASMQEDIYCCLVVTWNVQAMAAVQQSGIQGGESLLILPYRLFSFTTPVGQMDRAAPVLQTIFASYHPTLRWNAFVSNIDAMRKQADIDDNNMIRAANAEITEIQRQTFNDMIKSRDRQSALVGGLLSGTSPYKNPKDPNGPPQWLPGNQPQWQNSNGQTTGSGDDPNNDPSKQGGGTWSKLDPAGPGNF